MQMIIKGMIKMMNSDENVIGPVNLGNPNEFSILELAESIISLAGSKSKIIYKKLPTDDPKQRQPDISKAKNQLDWEPAIELEQGLNKTIEWFSKNI